jgi:hypothetical protein
VIYLTDAERTALLAYVKFGSYKRAAKALGIAESTIKAQLFAARERKGAATITHLAVLMFPALGTFYEIEHRT